MPQIVGEIKSSEVVAILIVMGWDPNWAQRVADANVWVIDATLPGGSGVYYGAHDPLTQQGHIYVGTLYVFHPGTIGHEAEHWVDHSRRLLDGEAFIAFKRDLWQYATAPGPYTVFSRQAYRVLTENPTDIAHYTTGIWEWTGRDPRRFPSRMVDLYWPFMARESVGTMGHRVTIPMVAR